MFVIVLVRHKTSLVARRKMLIRELKVVSYWRTAASLIVPHHVLVLCSCVVVAAQADLVGRALLVLFAMPFIARLALSAFLTVIPAICREPFSFAETVPVAVEIVLVAVAKPAS